MLFPIAVAIWFIGSMAGALYFASPLRRDRYDRRFAIFAYAQGIGFGLLPACGGEWGYSIFTVPIAVFLSAKIIDRRMERISQNKLASGLRRDDGEPDR
jgi:hypothetical protein